MWVGVVSTSHISNKTTSRTCRAVQNQQFEAVLFTQPESPTIQCRTVFESFTTFFFFSSIRKYGNTWIRVLVPDSASSSLGSFGPRPTTWWHFRCVSGGARDDSYNGLLFSLVTLKLGLWLIYTVGLKILWRSTTVTFSRFISRLLKLSCPIANWYAHFEFVCVLKKWTKRFIENSIAPVTDVATENESKRYVQRLPTKFYNSKEAWLQNNGQRKSDYFRFSLTKRNNCDIKLIYVIKYLAKADMEYQLRLVEVQYSGFAIAAVLCNISDICRSETLFYLVTTVSAVKDFVRYFELMRKAGNLMNKSFHLLLLCEEEGK